MQRLFCLLDFFYCNGTCNLLNGCMIDDNDDDDDDDDDDTACTAARCIAPILCSVQAIDFLVPAIHMKQVLLSSVSDYVTHSCTKQSSAYLYISCRS